MQIDYLDYLPEEFRDSAVQLYFNSLKEKLEPILGGDRRAHEVLASGIETDKCLLAVCNKKLVGVMGIQTNKGAFVNPSLKTMTKLYGVLGGILRMVGLTILHHSTSTDEFHIDGVAVTRKMRSEGIGSGLFDLLEQTASKKGIRTISLEVIDTNPRAKALYEQLGFVEIKTQTIWPFNLFIKFPFSSATLMIKTIG
jgi:ribosomal protein S18 acetylase RimI-like enzyme